MDDNNSKPAMSADERLWGCGLIFVSMLAIPYFAAGTYVINGILRSDEKFKHTAETDIVEVSKSFSITHSNKLTVSELHKRLDDKIADMQSVHLETKKYSREELFHLEQQHSDSALRQANPTTEFFGIKMTYWELTAVARYIKENPNQAQLMIDRAVSKQSQQQTVSH